METIFRKVSVKERLPEKPKPILGGQQVNHINRNYGIEKVVVLDPSKGYNDISIFSFHYETKKWYAEWDCRSYIVDESKYRDVTDVVTHWLEEVELPTEKQMAVNAEMYADQQNDCYTNDYDGHLKGQKEMRDFVLAVAPLTSNTNSH